LALSNNCVNEDQDQEKEKEKEKETREGDAAWPESEQDVTKSRS